MEDLIDENEDDGKQTMAKYPDASKHQNISFWKSAIRIATCVFVGVYGVLAPQNAQYLICVFALGIGVAEILGLYEELV